MNESDGMDKSWERSWTTEEMRNKRQEWSLAGDAGILKHLQQFSENVALKANKTQQAIDSLTSQLNETAIFIDNVTNTTLALANTQFIESRVQEDDIDISKKVENSQKDSKEEELSTTEFIAGISESIKQGLYIMEEKYESKEVVDSDSEDEEDARVMSVILGPKDPYQDRPLPYVIGSDKWNASSKIGLESSSSESEQIDEEDDEHEMDEDIIEKPFISNNGSEVNIARMSSFSNESERSNDAPYMNHGKLDSISQSTMSFASDSTTPINDVTKVQVENETPNFAEELAKRLGNVRQTLKPPITNETREPSINKFKDDLFTPEDNKAEDFFTDKPNNLFDDNKGLFEDEVSAKLWKQPRVFQSNIIPPSMDVPPPMSTISTKPKSEIDDLFGDGDSEDSDDIFSSKQPVKKITKDVTTDNKQFVNTENVQKKLLNVEKGKKILTIKTSTPQPNDNVGNLFSDEEEDDNDLFGISKKQSGKPVEGVQDLTASQDNDKKKTVDGASIHGGILTSGNESTLSSRILRRQSSGSSSSDTIPNYEAASNNDTLPENNTSSVVSANENSSTISRFNSFLHPNNENSRSSGISVQPNSTVDSITWDTDDILQGFTSTRLNSEEIFRNSARNERVLNDSLFVSNSLNPHNMQASFSRNDQSSTEQRTENSSSVLEDVFENDYLFGPPPLSKTDNKANKSKIPSLFDDSDSGDELFSTTSSGSRSQKSTDFLATTPQYPEKNKFTNRNSFFDDNIDIFGNKDSPDVDIFGIASKSSKDTSIGAKKIPEISSDSLPVDKTRGTGVSRDNATVKLEDSFSSRKSSLFDNEEEFDKMIKTSKQRAGTDEDDLFAVKKTKLPSLSVSNDAEEAGDLFGTKPPSASGKVQPVDQSSSVKKMEDVKGTSFLKEVKSEDSLSVNGKAPLLFSEDDDDYEDLFGKKNEKDVVQRTGQSVKTEKPEKPEVKEESGSVQSEEEKFSRSSDSDLETKKHPPTTLNIRGATSPPADDNSQAPRRAVSGKIKDLMGRMGDLKILSPTDTPPLWRKSEEKTDEEDETVDRDSDDGGCVSTQVRSSPIEETEPAKELPKTTSNGNSETAISFDVPAQVETLSTAASKSRVRIQAKRRPQSRHARKSALRHSGIDFDTVDTAENIPQEETTDRSKESSSNLGVTTNVDRLASFPSNPSDNIPRNLDVNLSITDDKSELGSISKESSMSANKNTLLSPSTDEEDLFDVPPDLPEDPQREDALFGRAPILSPIQSVLAEREPTYGRPLRDTVIGGNDENGDNNVTQKEPARTEISRRTSTNSIAETNFDVRDDSSGMSESRSEESKQQTRFDRKRSEENDEIERDTSDVFEEEYAKTPIDPLRDNTYDPLKDPSQLFAFVTKTPSPDKGKDLLFSDDDSSLFSSTSSKTRIDDIGSRNVADLFGDDTGDLFSGSLTKSVKKPLKDTKISFFDSKEENGQNDEEDSLFGSISRKSSVKSDQKQNDQKSATITAAKISRKTKSIFDGDVEDDEVDDLFAEQSVQSAKLDSAKVPRLPVKDETTVSSSEKSVKSSKLSDIFGDQSSTEDDIFASMKPVSKKVVKSNQLFPEDSDDDDSEIFGKSSSLIESKVNESRPIVKKSVTRDLKKTAEKIVEDPLSIFQDD